MRWTPWVAIAGPADVSRLRVGDTVAVPFRTRHGEQYFAGTITRLMPRTANVRFPDVDGTSNTWGVDHNRLFDLAGSETALPV